MNKETMQNIRIQEILEKIHKNPKQEKHLKNFQFENENLSEENRLFIVHHFEQISKNK